jgi:hypothetical protein
MQSKHVRNQRKIPEFLMSEFIFDDFDYVDVKNLYVGLLSISENCVIYVPVHKTPHYVFARNVIFNEKTHSISGYEHYKHYSEKNPDACSEKRYISLIKDIANNGYDWKNRPILVFQNWRRPFPRARKDVADGFHRLAVLAALGENKVCVGTLRYKHNVVCRMKRKFVANKR